MNYLGSVREGTDLNQQVYWFITILDMTLKTSLIYSFQNPGPDLVDIHNSIQCMYRAGLVML